MKVQKDFAWAGFYIKDFLYKKLVLKIQKSMLKNLIVKKYYC